MPLRACLSLALLLVALDARAQNLIPNPSFSDLFMLDGWSEDTPADSSWSSIDADEVANSGSVRIQNSFESNGHGVTSACMPVEAGELYRVAASTLWFDAESTTDGGVQARLGFYQTAGCTTALTFGGTGRVTTAPDDWRSIQASKLAPAGAQSALVDLWAWNVGGGGTFVAYFDEVELVSLPEPNAALAAACAVAMLAAIGADARARSRRVTVRRTEDLAR